MTQLISFYDDEPVRARDLTVRQLPLSEADQFDFGDEPTLARVVYVAHPRLNSHLIPFGQFDDMLMMDKFNEALRIVQTLGAYKVVTQTYRGDTSKLRVKADAGPVNPGFEKSKHGSREVSFEQYGTGGKRQDPSPIRWPHEPGFEAARRAVLLNGSRQVSITIESRSTFKTTSELAVRLRRAGFGLGIANERDQLQLLRLVAYSPADGKLHVPSEAAATAGPPDALEEPGSGLRPRSFFGRRQDG